MNSAAYTKSEYYGYAAGSVVLGGLILAPLMSFFISPDWCHWNSTSFFSDTFCVIHPEYPARRIN